MRKTRTLYNSETQDHSTERKYLSICGYAPQPGKRKFPCCLGDGEIASQQSYQHDVVSSFDYWEVL